MAVGHGGNRCVVTGCRTTNVQENTKENGITFFRVPKSSLKEWQEQMPSIHLTSNSRLCSRHFDENDILKGREILNVFHHYKKWMLKPGSLPKHFLPPGMFYRVVVNE